MIKVIQRRNVSSNENRATSEPEKKSEYKHEVQGDNQEGILTMAMSSGEMQTCISNCTECHKSCVTTLTYCLRQGGKHAAADHIQLLIDCAASCQECIDFMLRESKFHPKACGICAEICTACAASCERMGDDQKMKQCAATCRKCAESCQKMAAAA